MNYTEVVKFDYNPDDANDKKASMKYLFLARFGNYCIKIQRAVQKTRSFVTKLCPFGAV